MTKNQEWLLKAATDARDYLNELSTGRRRFSSAYQDLSIGRNLAAAIEAVEHDVIHEASKLLEVGRH